MCRLHRGGQVRGKVRKKGESHVLNAWIKEFDFNLQSIENPLKVFKEERTVIKAVF